MEGMAPEIDGKIFITEIAGVNEASELPSPGDHGDGGNYWGAGLRFAWAGD